MDFVFQGRPFRYAENIFQNAADRDAYFALAKAVFHLDFNPWYASGFWGNFIPYTLYDGNIAAASVGIAVSDFLYKGKARRYAQVSTVMTLPEYRGMGLNRFIMEQVLQNWQGQSDLTYLFANESVLDFYPKFGFEKAVDYAYSLSLSKKAGSFRKLQLTNADDIRLIKDKYETCNNPFSALPMLNNTAQLMFHLYTFLPDDIYYAEEFDAVAILEHEKETLFLYDIYTDSKSDLRDILGLFANDSTTRLKLGFMPKRADGFTIEANTNPDDTVFILPGGDNPFAAEKITLPFLSHA